jgi:hypothetical protein
MYQKKIKQKNNNKLKPDIITTTMQHRLCGGVVRFQRVSVVTRCYRGNRPVVTMLCVCGV